MYFPMQNFPGGLTNAIHDTHTPFFKVRYFDEARTSAQRSYRMNSVVSRSDHS